MEVHFPICQLGDKVLDMTTNSSQRMRVLANGDIVDCTRLPNSARNTLYKTELCKHFMEYGTCQYNNKCQFAHGEHELRGVLRHPKYKTAHCKAYSSTGKCQYGSRCRFIHQKVAENDELENDSDSIKKTTDISPSQEINLKDATATMKSLAPLTKEKQNNNMQGFSLLSGINYAAFNAPKAMSEYSSASTITSAAESVIDLSLLTNNLQLNENLPETVNETTADDKSTVDQAVSRLTIFQSICS